MTDQSASDATPEKTAPAPGSIPVATRPVDSKLPPRQPLKGTKPSFAKRPAPAATAAASPAKTEAAAPPSGANRNKLIFATCSVVTLAVAAMLLNNPGKKPVAAKTQAPNLVPAPAPAAVAPAAPAANDPAAMNARLAARLAEQKQAEAAPATAVAPEPADEARAALIRAAEAGGSAQWLAVAEDYLKDDTEANRTAARPWLEKVAANQTSRGFLLLGEMEENHGDKAKAVELYAKGAASVASGKSPARDAKLEEFARRLDRLQAPDEAAKIRARINP